MFIKSIFRNYQVSFIEDFTSILTELADQGPFFIIDSLVLDVYGDRITTAVPKGRFLVIEANERNKSFDSCRGVIETLVEKRVRRDEKLVAIGGGIIQDITAFSASIIYRGMDWIFFPTTLLAQSDSCIGSKTSINLDDKKNLIGNFYPPAAVFIDMVFLSSLGVDDIKSGIGEMLHYYFYAESPFFNKMIKNYNALIRNREMLSEYIRESLVIKKGVIEIDEFDRAERNKFNYGHTFGHALESVTEYSIKHGQAVTVGMDLANYVSLRIGFMEPNIFHDLHAKLFLNFPVFDWQDIALDRYCNLLTKDKKNVGGNIGCILASKPGALFKKQLPLDDAFRGVIRDYFLNIVVTECTTV